MTVPLHTREKHRMSYFATLAPRISRAAEKTCPQVASLCTTTSLLGHTGDLVEVAVWLWKIKRYLAQPFDSPGRRAGHNVHKTGHREGHVVRSAKIGQAVKHANYDKWVTPAGKHEDRGVWAFGCRHLPDTFVEDVQFVICQAFFLEDSYDGIVNAAMWNAQACVSA